MTARGTAANVTRAVDDERPGSADTRPTLDVVWIPDGTFRMGSDRHYPEERPAHDVYVDGFWIDRHEVTTAQFAEFVAATGYVTVAERPLDPADYPGVPPEHLAPGSMVFTRTTGPVDLRDQRNWWAWTPGASWRHPEGPGRSAGDRADHPVVQVAHEDAAAYARWAGKALPTEAEWERAARGGLDGAEYTWGDDRLPDSHPRANWWQGQFPWQNTLDDGHEGSAPVGSFPANGFGLYDMAGNVWEWTDDWFAARRQPVSGCCMPRNPRGGDERLSYNPRQTHFQIPRKVVKGGSFLCADNYCMRYRPAARQAQDVDSGMSHIGFRCVVRSDDAREQIAQ